MPREILLANLYHLCSRAYSAPATMNAQMPEQLRPLMPHLPDECQSKAAALADAWDHALKDLETTTLAYARLFVGPFEVLASPYASFYLEPDQQIMGDVSSYVARMYAEAGLEPGTGPREVPDHVALEWEFLYFLTHQYIATEDVRWRELRDRFYIEHVAVWLPLLAATMVKADVHPFYKALAEFQSAMCGCGMEL